MPVTDTKGNIWSAPPEFGGKIIGTGGTPNTTIPNTGSSGGSSALQDAVQKRISGDPVAAGILAGTVTPSSPYSYGGDGSSSPGTAGVLPSSSGASQGGFSSPYTWTAPDTGVTYGFNDYQQMLNYITAYGGSLANFQTQPGTGAATTTPASTAPPIPVNTAPTISETGATPAPAGPSLPAGMGRSASGFTVQGNAAAATPSVDSLANIYQQVFGSRPPGLENYLQTGDVQAALQGQVPLYMQNDALMRQFLQRAIQNRLGQQNQTGE